MIAIYKLVDPRDSSVIYIGQTESPKYRLINHCNPSGGSPKLKAAIRGIRDDGLRPDMQVIEWADTRGSALIRERHFISDYLDRGEPLCNVHGVYPNVSEDAYQEFRELFPELFSGKRELA